MKFGSLTVLAHPAFEASCPKCNRKLFELENGWISVCFWCDHCKVPYEITLRKMSKWNQEEVDKQLAKRWK